VGGRVLHGLGDGNAQRAQAVRILRQDAAAGVRLVAPREARTG
jgi:hypothetical protein